MKRWTWITFPLLLSALLGCAIGGKIAYGDGRADLAYRGSGRVAVAVHDQRSYVRSGNKKPDFVGLVRGGYGNPFNVGTKSGRTLAEEMTDPLARSLAAAGFEAVPVVVGHSADAGATRAALLHESPRRAILLTLNEWKSDTYMNTDLIYDVTLSVYDDSGARLAVVSRSGTDGLGGSFINAPGHARQAVPDAWRRKLRELLEAPEIAAVLR